MPRIDLWIFLIYEEGLGDLNLIFDVASNSWQVQFNGVKGLVVSPLSSSEESTH